MNLFIIPLLFIVLVEFVSLPSLLTNFTCIMCYNLAKILMNKGTLRHYIDKTATSAAEHLFFYFLRSRSD
jgi:hypothetical protein